MFRNHFQFLCAEEGGGAAKTDLQVLDEGLEPIKEEKVEGKEEEKEDDEEEGEEIEEEGEEEEEEKEEGEDSEQEEEEELTRHSYSEIKKEFPDFFKKFPGLKTAFFREQEFTKVFPTIEDAQRAAEAESNFEEIRQEVMSGNAEKVLSDIAELSPKSMKTFAENFLPSLRKLDESTYIAVTTPVIKNILKQVIAYGKEQEDDKVGENIQNAAKVVHKAIFRTYDITDADDTPRKKDDSLEEEKRTFYAGKQQELMSSVANDLDGALDKEIERGLDPTNLLKDRPGLKKRMIKDIKEEVRNLLDKDEAHMTRMNSLWSRERRNGFSGTLKDSIKTAFLSRAKALIPKVRQQVRADLLGVQKEKDQTLRKKAESRKEDIPIGGIPRSGGKSVTVKEAREKKMTDMDIINAG